MLAMKMLKNNCKREEIRKLILEIPDDRRIAEAYSRGEMVIHALPEYKKTFETCWTKITDLHENALHTEQQEKAVTES